MNSFYYVRDIDRIVTDVDKDGHEYELCFNSDKGKVSLIISKQEVYENVRRVLTEHKRDLGTAHEESGDLPHAVATPNRTKYRWQ
jgi:hypothetical protein